MPEAQESAPSNVEWVRWGEKDPFWGVASWPGRERDGANPWTAEEFYALGHADWQDFRRRLVERGSTFGDIVEIGSGAGRLTRHLAEDFRTVVGVDVSPGMIDTARSYITEPNIEFRLGDGLTLPVDSGSADVAFSTHVFQHFESLDMARRNFAEIARVLRPGGLLLVHLPTFGLPRRRMIGSGWARTAVARLSDVRAAVRRRRGVDFMRGLEYPWEWLFSELPRLGFVDVELVLFALRSNADVHHCILARNGVGP